MNKNDERFCLEHCYGSALWEVEFNGAEPITILEKDWIEKCTNTKCTLWKGTRK